MRSIFLLALFSFFYQPIEAQSLNKFDKKECKEMLAICNSFTFLDLYGTDSVIIPKGYVKTYQSETIGMDNMYQIYKKDTKAVICFRGSTSEMSSWWENLHAAMIPASGEIKGDLDTLKYVFARSEGAAIHSGYGLGLVFLTMDLKPQLLNLKNEGIESIVITGHSQGGALANLLFALLNTNQNCDICEQFTYKVYAFAAPMVGNKVFCEEYNRRFCKTNKSFNIINKEDPIPGLPFKFKDSISYEKNNTGKSLNWAINNIDPTKEYNKRKFSTKRISFNKMLTKFYEYQLNGYVTHKLLFISEVASRRADKHLEHNIELPEFISSVDFDYLGNRVKLSPFEYPTILKDSTKLDKKLYRKRLTDDKLTRIEKRYFYKRGSWAYQHQSYNYYVQFLKQFHNEEYNNLEMKYMPEDL